MAFLGKVLGQIDYFKEVNLKKYSSNRYFNTSEFVKMFQCFSSLPSAKQESSKF